MRAWNDRTRALIGPEAVRIVANGDNETRRQRQKYPAVGGAMADPLQSEMTRTLQSLKAGDDQAEHRLFNLVYEELRAMAAR